MNNIIVNKTLLLGLLLNRLCSNGSISSAKI